MVMFVLISTYSYALFTISIEQKNALSVVAGNLFYRAEDITLPYEVTLQPGESKQLPITIESLNSIDSIYQIYSNDLPEGVSVSYISELGSSKAMIGVAGEKKDVTLVLQNNSSSIQVIHIGIQGGLPEREPIIKDGYTAVSEIYALQKDYAYTGDVQVFKAPASGYYRLEAWGASGGSDGVLVSPDVDTLAGRGAYTSGVIYLEEGTTFYIYVGGQGSYDNAVVTNNLQDSFVWNNGGYNGGGSSYGREASSGGGATDFALVYSDVTLNNNHIYTRSEESYRSRIMVAAGGGAASGHQMERASFLNANTLSRTMGGYGGAYIGRNGYSTFGFDACSPQTDRGCPSQGATPTAGGTSYYDSKQTVVASKNIAGSFGYGGYGYGRDYAVYYGYASGGGGGYYGGGGTYGPEGAGGGSSFVSGAAGVNVLAENTILTHTNDTMHASGYYFIDTEMQSDVWEGNGKAKITYVGQTYEKNTSQLNGVRYIKDCLTPASNVTSTTNVWVELQAIQNGHNIALHKSVSGTGVASNGRPYTNLVDGDMTLDLLAGTNDLGEQCITVDLGQSYDLDEVAVWLYYGDGRVYNDHTLSVSSNNSSWTVLVDNELEYPTADGIHVNSHHTVSVEDVKGGMLSYEQNGNVVTLHPYPNDTFTYEGVGIYDENGDLLKTLSAATTSFTLDGNTRVVLRPRWKCKDKIILLIDSDIVPSFSLANQDGATITYHFNSQRNYFYLYAPTAVSARRDAYTTSSYPLTDFSSLTYTLSASMNAPVTGFVGVSNSRSTWINVSGYSVRNDIPASSIKSGTLDISTLKSGNYYIGVQMLTNNRIAQLTVNGLTLRGRTYS